MHRSDRVWLALMRLGAACGCHQRADRSFSVGAYQLPLCARCTGVVLGQGCGLLLWLAGVRLPVALCAACLLLLLADWLLQHFRVLESTNIRRLVTGVLAGAGYLQILLLAATRLLLLMKQ